MTYDRAGPTRVSATTTAATNQPQFTAKISAQTVLANGYIDFGTWGGFTPYVGAGVGIARLKSVDYVDTTDSPSSQRDRARAEARSRILPGPRWPALPIR